MKHFYTPIAFYNGKVLKYAGLCTEKNQEWFMQENPGTIIKPEYLGDRIKEADDSIHVGY